MAAASSNNRDSSVSDMLDGNVQNVLQTSAPPAVPKKGPVEQLLSLNTFRRWVREKTGYALFGFGEVKEKNGAAIPEIKDDELRAIFREFDLNGDGFIQMNELRSVMVKMGQSPTDEELNAMFNAADKDKDGNIDFHEFMGIARANPLSMSLRSVFEELDVDGDGHITRSELRTAFERMGHSLSDEEIKSIYRQVDVNQDGKINFEEFCQMMTRKKA